MKLPKDWLWIIVGYVVFMLLFYFWGITKARFMEFVVIGLLTGFYAFGVYWVKKIWVKKIMKK